MTIGQTQSDRKRLELFAIGPFGVHDILLFERMAGRQESLLKSFDSDCLCNLVNRFARCLLPNVDYSSPL